MRGVPYAGLVFVIIGERTVSSDVFNVSLGRCDVVLSGDAAVSDENKHGRVVIMLSTDTVGAFGPLSQLAVNV